MNDKISSGNKKLDLLIDGGFQRNSMILLAGNPGTGKTLLSSRFIFEGATKFNQPGIYACFSETKNRFILYLNKSDMDFTKLIRQNMVKVLDLSIASEVELQSAINKIFQAVVSLKANRLVIDSITAMAMGLESEIEKRHLIRLLYKLIIQTGCTTISITDIPWNSKRIGESVEEFIADGIILMENHYDESNTLRRTMRIIKMRGTNHSKKTHLYEINEDGIQIKV
jgi:circadian clock protein KaiC